MIARHLAIVLLACTMWLEARAQSTLADLVSEGNTEWLLGQWEGQTDDATPVRLSFSWDLDKHVVVLHGKIGALEFKGYSAVDPGTRNVKYVGFDNRGAVSKGLWSVEGQELILRFESQSAEATRKMAAVFAGGASEGLQLRLHSVNDWDILVSPARATLKLKKSK